MSNINKLIEENKRLLKIIEGLRITETKISENLKNEDSLILNVLNRMPFVCFINTKDYCVWVNKCCEPMMGYTQEEWTSQTAEEFISKFHPDDIPEYFYKDFDEFKEYIDPKLNFIDAEYRMKNKAGEWRWVYSTASPLEFDEKGDLVLTMGTAIDITDRKNAEEEVRKLNSELIESHNREKLLLDKQNEYLRIELDGKKRELATISELISDRNKDLIKIKSKLEYVSLHKEKGECKLKELNDELETIISDARSWDILFSQFSGLYPAFHTNLQKRYPNLSIAENKICVLIRLEMKTKEIAEILNISVRTVEKHRSNIRQKMEISTNSSLSIEIQKL